MNYKNNIFKSSFLIIILVSLFSVSGSVLAATNNISVQFKPQIGIPNSEFQVGTGVAIGTEVTKNGTTTSRSDLMARYVSAFYNWSITIVSVIAVLMLMAAGLLWLTSGGDSERINQAKKLIGNSLLGSALLIGSWFLLNTINPNLTSLPVIETIVIKKVNFGCCDKTIADKKAAMTSDDKCVTGNFYANKQLNAEGKCESQICCVLKYTDGAGGKPLVDNCVNTLESSCSAMTKKANLDAYGVTYSSEMKNELCENVADCAGPTGNKEISCVGKKDATSEKTVGGSQTYWCYGEKFYFDKGKMGEPCGNEPYSKCCAEYWGSTLDLGGRDCCNTGTAGCTKAYCCKYNANGTKK